MTKIAVWGSGAIGATIGAFLVDAGHDVLFVDSAVAHVDAINRNGLVIEGPVKNLVAVSRAEVPENVDGEFDVIFLCVKALHTGVAIEQASRFLSPTGYVVSLQNGLNWNTIGAKVGEARTLASLVNFGADLIAPGVVHLGGRGTVAVGELNGSLTERLRFTHELLCLFEPAAIATKNVKGFLWSKSVYSAILFGTALTNDSIADCLEAESCRPALRGLAMEVVEVATAVGIKLEPFDGFIPDGFTAGDQNAIDLTLAGLAAHNRRSAKTHTGIWRDLAVLHRQTEVDAVLGSVVSFAKDLGVETPLIQRTIDLIHGIERDEISQASELLIGLTAAPLDLAATPVRTN